MRRSKSILRTRSLWLLVRRCSIIFFIWCLLPWLFGVHFGASYAGGQWPEERGREKGCLDFLKRILLTFCRTNQDCPFSVYSLSYVTLPSSIPDSPTQKISWMKHIFQEPFIARSSRRKNRVLLFKFPHGDLQELCLLMVPSLSLRAAVQIIVNCLSLISHRRRAPSSLLYSCPSFRSDVTALPWPCSWEWRVTEDGRRGKVATESYSNSIRRCTWNKCK